MDAKTMYERAKSNVGCRPARNKGDMTHLERVHIGLKEAADRGEFSYLYVRPWWDPDTWVQQLTEAELTNQGYQVKSESYLCGHMMIRGFCTNDDCTDLVCGVRITIPVPDDQDVAIARLKYEKQMDKLNSLGFGSCNAESRERFATCGLKLTTANSRELFKRTLIYYHCAPRADDDGKDAWPTNSLLVPIDLDVDDLEKG